MNIAATDVLLDRMFAARRLALRAGIVFAALSILLLCDHLCNLLTVRGEAVVVVAALMVLAVVLVGSLITYYYVFCVGLREAGLAYAIGHLFLCVVLAPPILGTILVPLMVRYDIERRRQSQGELPGSECQ
jgi:hypothetical protein